MVPEVIPCDRCGKTALVLSWLAGDPVAVSIECQSCGPRSQTITSASPDQCERLLSFLSQLDQLNTEAEIVLANAGDPQLLPLAEELRERLEDLRVRVEEKLDQLGKTLLKLVLLTHDNSA